jgi:acyl-CoA thioester hydrolase
MEYLAALGFDYQAMLELGMDMVYAEALCRYKAPAFVEETLNVHTRVAHVGNSSLRFEFSVYEENSNRLVVTGHLVAVAIDPKTQEKIRVPDVLRRVIGAFEGTNWE